MAAIIVDANIVVNTMLKQPYSVPAERRMEGWRTQGVRLYAPAHWIAEVTSALRFAVFARVLNSADARELITLLPDMGIQVVIPDGELLQLSLDWAERLGQSKAYDAQYVALAEHLNAEFWSADERLVNALNAQGADWAHWIGEV